MVSAEQGKVLLAPHQVEAASRVLALLDEHGGAVLADATGLGKTYAAIAVARLISPALIVAPASLRGMWRESLGRAGVTAEVESYEALSRGRSSRSERPKLLVLDEAHHARNPRARRYAALADLAWGAKVLLLTATPIHNSGRDLRTLLALFVGTRASTFTDEEIRRFVVRRTADSIRTTRLPDVDDPEWLAVPPDPDTLRAIATIPPAVPASDGGAAHALMVLGLIRAWSSSEEALRSSLRRRLRRAASFVASLECGRVPDRRDLAAWPVVDDAIQLGFPELFATNTQVDVGEIREALARHGDGVRAILRRLDRLDGSTDRARARHLAAIRARHAGCAVIAFTQFADTAHAAFHSWMRPAGVAVVTGNGARVASGRVTVDEIVRGFDTERSSSERRTMPLDLLVSTDVLSEGLSLRRARVLVHLDLPWTLARLEQRLGRLRRLGSPHRRLAVYAIGPPVESQELVPVLRALQRKARLSTSVVGHEELQSSLPLLGRRLTRATCQIVRRGAANAREELRARMAAWASGTVETSEQALPSARIAVCLVTCGSSHRLLAVTDHSVSENPIDVLQAVRLLPSCLARQQALGGVQEDITDSVVERVDEWLEEQRGRDLARVATDVLSPAHTVILRQLQDFVTRAARSERAGAVARVERCRQLVLASKGVGAENALAAMAAGTLDLDSLEQRLALRQRHADTSKPAYRLVALICGDPIHQRPVGAMVLR
jgi:superfamily II DNA or RNA helicase